MALIADSAPPPEPRTDVTVGDIAKAILLAKPPGGLGRTMLLVGAGCSVSAGIPHVATIARRLAGELAERLCGTAPGTDPAACHAALVAEGYLSPPAPEIDWHKTYQEIFERHYTAPDYSRDLFSTLVDETRGAINWAHLCLGEIVRRGFVSTVLTTNFDQLVLSGMTRAGMLPVVCDGIESLGRITGAPRHPQLIELHGSRHTYLLRNSAQELEEVPNAPAAIAAIRALMNHATTFIAVGYGGRERSVMQLLTDAARAFPHKNLFWVSYSPNPQDIDPQVRGFLATSRHARLLTKGDADTFFLNLCTALRIGVPRAIAAPLDAIAQQIEEVGASGIADPAIQAEIARARQRLQRLRAFSDDLVIGDAAEEAIAKIREARLAGDAAGAYRLAKAARGDGELAALDPKLLEEAVTAALNHGRASPDGTPLRDATEWLRFLLRQDDVSPPQWARWAGALGEALARLGQNDPDVSRVEEAIGLLQQASERLPREEAPLEWGAMQTDLGAAQLILGNRRLDAPTLRKARAAFLAALAELKRELVPLDWAEAQHGLGATLAALAGYAADPAEAAALLADAVTAYRLALEERKRERVPLDWARTQFNLGCALLQSGLSRSAPDLLEAAADALREAMEVLRPETHPGDWAAGQQVLGEALFGLATLRQDGDFASAAAGCMRRAAEGFRTLGNHVGYGYSLQRAAQIEQAAAAKPA